MAQMDVAHHVGPGQAQHVDEILAAAEIALDVERQRLHLGAHGAVAQEHALGQEIEDMRHLSPPAPLPWRKAPIMRQMATISSARLSV